MVDSDCQLSVRRQCKLLNIHRSLVYYEPVGESLENLGLMEEIDRQHLDDPSAGVRRMSLYLSRKTGETICEKRVRRLMRKMGIEAVYPRKRTTIPGGPSGVAPYLLRDMTIDHANQVWSMDITYIPMRRGFMYLFAVIDWYSRKVMSWELSNTLDTDFCLKGLRRAVAEYGHPEIVNTDQGCQFTSNDWGNYLKGENIRQSMDGRGRWVDNVMIERFWRTIKYEDIYLQSYENPLELEKGIGRFVERYNSDRPHQSLGGHSPDAVYSGGMSLAA
jgi:putative transposase